MDKKDMNEVLQQEWVHSREEDTPTEMVFRPASYDFPPARGRKSFALDQVASLSKRELHPLMLERKPEALGKLKAIAWLFIQSPHPSRVV